MSEFCYKQVLVFRSDLKLSKGKIATQSGHAAVSAAEKTRKHHLKWWKAWLDEGQRKIAIKVESEKKLLLLQKQSEAQTLPCALITDKGLTEVPPGTITCLGIGPAPTKKIDKVTGSLPLL